MKISIIIPILNEESIIRDKLSRLQSFRDAGHELVMVDGGSSDASSDLAAEVSNFIVSSDKGRARQMNAGAMVATGDLLLFLHIDTDLSGDNIKALSRVVEDEQDVWGRFNVRLSGKHYMFRIIETMMNWRSRFTSIATGDQAIFVSKSLFETAGGFADISLMEDIELCSRLKKIVKPICLSEKVTSSSRRWEVSGIVPTIFLMWRLRLAYWLGADPDQLVQRYYR